MIKVALIAIISLVLGSWSPALCAEQDDAALIKAASSAKVTLQKGLTASQRDGERQAPTLRLYRKEWKIF
jgi:hypothetical protein